MIVVAVSLIPLAIWTYLLFGRGWFWLCRERDDSAAATSGVERTQEPDAWPSIVAIIPARDEAGTIARSVGSLLRQDYSGPALRDGGRRPEHGWHGCCRVRSGERC